jgi:hypothetical protein
MQVSVVPSLLQVTAPKGTEWSVQLKMDISMNVQFKSHTEILTEE